MSLGKRLRELRESRGFSQQAVCNHVNIEQSTLANYENDRRAPKNDILLSLCEFFNVTTDYLLGLSEIPNLNLDNSSKQDEIWKIREEMANNSNLKVLFDLGSKASKEDLEFVIKTLEILKEKGELGGENKK